MAQPSNQAHKVNKFFPTFLFAILTIAVCHTAFAAVGNKTWQSLSTEHAVILFQNSADLRTFNNKIQFKTQKPAEDLNAEVSRKVDALFVRAQQILGMKGFVSPISVKIFKNRSELDQAFQKLYKENGKARAWYSHDKLTVYLQLNDLTEGILAHEFAHAIIDHYLIVPPPSESAEILARFVDNNLKKEMAQGPQKGAVMGYSQE